VKVVAIAGGSGSGKTTLGSYIVEQDPLVSLLISLDNYYLNKDEQIIRNGFCNFDHPLALDKELLLSNLKELDSNYETNIPKYCFRRRDRVDYQKVKKPSIVVIEGLYAIEFLKEIEAAKIFVEADSDLLLARRIKRDLKNRGRSLDNIFEQYFSEVKPAYDNYIVHQKNIANFLIKNNGQNIEMFLSKFRELDV